MNRKKCAEAPLFAGLMRPGIASARDSDEARSLRPLQAAACTYRIAFGQRAGQKVLTVLTVQGVMPRDADFKQNLCADISFHGRIFHQPAARPWLPDSRGA